MNKCKRCGDKTYNMSYCYKCIGTKEEYIKQPRKWRENEKDKV